ncbi:hypothetical protein [Brachybacterium kimchii]|uniref:Uncharacterized protein n=1 Tax=Brachybacterium kimchii TaxID=2942909 RepID=A0ABY4NB73_9MICO|nr:hypothetical protein [Brachybacterium kimchii]UQN30683.1 hypothetical protein M4486_05105 [Brachybacterium kimchii]
MSTMTRFRVYGTEFCNHLQAVALFQADARKIPQYAAVRCIARTDGLTMIAHNGLSCAVADLSTLDPEGAGLFSIPTTQVKALLAIFHRKLPKGTLPDEYVLEVKLTARTLTVTDVSGLFTGDEYVMALPDPDSLEPHEEPEDAHTMRAAASARGALADAAPTDLTDGVHFSPTELGRLARAAGTLGWNLHIRPVGHMLIAPIAETFVAATYAELNDRPADGPHAPFIDERALADVRRRLDEIVEQGAL